MSGSTAALIELALLLSLVRIVFLGIVDPDVKRLMVVAVRVPQEEITSLDRKSNMINLAYKLWRTLGIR